MKLLIIALSAAGNTATQVKVAHQFLSHGAGKLHTGFPHDLAVAGDAVGTFHGNKANTTWENEDLQCGVTSKASRFSNPRQRCPAACPVFASDKQDASHCTFRCVEPTTGACASMDPSTPVVDEEKGICRGCFVAGCAQCMLNGEDKCAVCDVGHSMDSYGNCNNNYFFVWYILGAILGAIVLFIICWVWSLNAREPVGAHRLHSALQTRSLMKNRHGTTRALYSFWCTNLCSDESVAGPGMLLQFNFQVAIIVWAFAVAAAWYLVAVNTDDALLVIGTKVMETARQNCIIVQWGYYKQHALMWVKQNFLLGLYLVTFFLALCFSVRQLRHFQQLDNECDTYKDFAAQCKGLPRFKGKEDAEYMMVDFVQEQTKIEVVGVSICWDYNEHQDMVMKIITEDYERHSAAIVVQKYYKGRSARSKFLKILGKALAQAPGHSPKETPRAAAPPGWNPLKPFFDMIENKLLAACDDDSKGPQRHHGGQKGVGVQMMNTIGVGKTATSKKPSVVTPNRPGQGSPPQSARSPPDSAREEEEMWQDVATGLQMLRSGDTAYIVFNSEGDRDKAVEMSEDQPLIYKYKGEEYPLQLSVPRTEPDTVHWHHYLSEESLMQKIKKYGAGACTMIAAFLIWTFGFYLPYAIFIMNFNYENGQEPGIVSSISFSMVVCLGNVTMYFVCATVADNLSFKNVDDEQACYMLLYCAACMFNVGLDMVTTYIMAYKMMVGSDIRTVDGTPLGEVKHFTEIFETYAMQKSLGENLWLYAFPSTFIIPFLLEPVVTILLPLVVMSAIVRVHKGVKEKTACDLLAAIPMDLSRYADIHLNIILAVLVFYFPGGYTVGMFVALGFSSIWIYGMDQFRIICVVPGCNFAGFSVDWWSQWLMSVSIGLLLACYFFKSNCEEGFDCLDGYWLIAKCSAAFLFHVIIHSLALLHLVPLFRAPVVDSERQTLYEDHAPTSPFSWFNCNPVFCLRSTYHYGHPIPCTFALRGKLAHIKKSDEHGIGQFFEVTGTIQVEDFDMKVDTAQMRKDAEQAAADMKNAARERMAGFSRRFTSHEL